MTNNKNGTKDRISRLEKQIDDLDGKYESKESGEATHFKLRKMMDDDTVMSNQLTGLITDMWWLKKTIFGIITILISLFGISVWDIFVR